MKWEIKLRKREKEGKQVKQRKPKLIDGVLVDEYIMKCANPIWLQQNVMWEYI